MITQTTIDEYLKKIQTLQTRVIQGQAEKRDLQQAILTEAKHFSGERQYEAFFKAESDFYREDYQAALKHYLEATEVPSHHFFCYRASAFLYNELGQQEKALEFAEKAIAQKPDDVSSLNMLVNKIPQAKDSDSWQQWKSQLETILGTQAQTSQPCCQEIEPAPNAKPKAWEPPKTSCCSTPKNEPKADALENLTEFSSSPYEVARESTQKFISDSLGVDADANKALETRIHAFKEFQQQYISEYVLQGKQRTLVSENAFYVLNGWDAVSNETSKAWQNPVFLTDGVKPTSGGYFLRWNNKGIAINPGHNFLSNLHQQGLNIFDIDYVVVTRGESESYADLKAIYHLNYRLNSSKTGKLHLIKYYLHQQAYQQIGSALKANFKQERDSVHCLDFYLDSPEVETTELAEGLTFSYFPTCSQEAISTLSIDEEDKRRASLGVRFDLSGDKTSPHTGNNPLRIGYISGTAWSPFISNHLGTCELLVAGLENIIPSDYGKVKYNEDSLGYYGSFSLLEEVAPRLMLCSEYNGQQGDIRLEVAKKMRQEFTPSQSRATSILPGDTGLCVDLEQFKIVCSVTKCFVDPTDVRVCKTEDSFGQLLYLSPKTFV